MVTLSATIESLIKKIKTDSFSITVTTIVTLTLDFLVALSDKVHLLLDVVVDDSYQIRV